MSALFPRCLEFLRKQSHTINLIFPMNASSHPDNRLFDLVDSLIAGFEELVSVVSLQTETEKTLKARIDLAANEVRTTDRVC